MPSTLQNSADVDFASGARVNTGTKRIPSRWLPPAVFLAFIVGLFVFLNSQLHQSLDFGVFYYAAQMVRHGDGARLYDLSAQQNYQHLYQRPAELLFLSPPFSLIPYLPLAWFRESIAFALWTIASALLLLWSMLSLNRAVHVLPDFWPVLIACGFYPVIAALLQGQASLLILSAIIAGWLSLRAEKPLIAGLLLSIALIKFPIVLGLLTAIFFRRMWRVIVGLVIGGTLLLAASLALTGWHGLARYPAFLVAVRSGSGIDPRMMSNLRGLVVLLVGRDVSVLALVVLVVLGAAVAAYLWKDLDTGFAIALTISLLTSLHLNPHDSSMLLLPLWIGAQQMIKQRWAGIALLAWLIPPVQVYLLQVHLYALMTIPLCGLVVLLRWEQQNRTRLQEPRHRVGSHSWVG